VTSVTLTLPGEIVPTVQHGALNELESAAAAIVALCEPPGEGPAWAYKAAYTHLTAANELLGEIGYTAPEPPVDIEVDLVRHHWVLLRSMRGQQRADMELIEEMTPADQSAADRRVQVLEELINAAS
jgi:hypothetical protein